MTRENLKMWWDYIQSLFDIDGDLWMAAFTTSILIRIVGVPLWHWPPLTASEACTYGSAVGAFAYSNHGGPKA